MSFSTLFQKDLTIKRPTAGEGYPDEHGNWVTSVTVTDVPMKGEIEPYKNTDVAKGEETLPFRDGYDQSSARTVFTNQLVYPVSRKHNREPDWLVIDGEEFVCWYVFNYMDSAIERLRHCESVFVERSALKESP